MPDTEGIDWTKVISIAAAIGFGLLAWYYRSRNLKLNQKKEARDAAKHAQEEAEKQQQNLQPLSAAEKYKQDPWVMCFFTHIYKIIN